MRIAASDRRRERLDTIDAYTVAGGPDRLPGTVSEIIEAEGAAEKEAAAEPALHAWLFHEGAEPESAALNDLGALAADDACFVWVDLSGYRRDDLEGVARELDLPEAAVRSARASWQRPRVGVFGERVFVAVTVPRVDLEAQRLVASELDLFVGRNYLVSAHKLPLPFTDRVMARAGQNPDLLKLDSAFLLSILIDELLVHYEELTEGLEDEIEAMEERALTDTSDTFLEDLLQLKRFVFAYYRLASQHRAIAEAFLRPDFPLVGGDVIEPYFRDLEARLGRMLDGLEAAKETINGAFDIYVSQVGHRTNEIMRVLAIVSTVLLPATVILGFFGTNFEIPPLMTETSFMVMNGLIALITVTCLILFYRWGWLRRAAPDRRHPSLGRTSTSAHREEAARR